MRFLDFYHPFSTEILRGDKRFVLRTRQRSAVFCCFVLFKGHGLRHRLMTT